MNANKVLKDFKIYLEKLACAQVSVFDRHRDARIGHEMLCTVHNILKEIEEKERGERGRNKRCQIAVKMKSMSELPYAWEKAFDKIQDKIAGCGWDCEIRLKHVYYYDRKDRPVAIFEVEYGDDVGSFPQDDDFGEIDKETDELTWDSHNRYEK